MEFFKRSTSSSTKPLPLKQRTSSLDTRRDYSHRTWWSLLKLLKIREYFVTVDNFSIWRRHSAWAMENGKDLRNYMTQRYGSSMVFMSLLLSTELAILFNSAGVTSDVRAQLREGNHASISFWAGFMIILSSLFTVLSLISLFTAWGMVNSIDEINAHCIFRSAIGQYAAELPGRLIVCSIYSFLISFMMFFFLLLPVGPWSLILLGLALFLFIHIVSTFSAFGRVIMHTGAMGNARVFSPEYEEFLLPHTLHANLLIKAQANLANNASIIRQYRRKQQPIDRHLTEEDMYDHLSGNNSSERDIPQTIPFRPRADSTVRFADIEQGVNTGNIGKNIGKNGGDFFSNQYHYNRSLSAISDVSSQRFSDVSSLLDDRPTPMTPSLRKSSYGGPSEPPRRPSPPSIGYPSPLQQRPPLPNPSAFGPSNLTFAGDVSTSSLETWLQQVSPGDPTVSSKSYQKRTSDLSTESNSNHRLSPIPDDNSNSNSVARPSSLTPVRPKTPTRKSSNSSPAGTPTTLTPVHSEISFDHQRDLSEEERFVLDYGDFDEGDSPQKFASEYRVLEEPPSVPRKTSDGNDGERKGLLDGSIPNDYPYYGASTFSNGLLKDESTLPPRPSGPSA